MALVGSVSAPVIIGRDRELATVAAFLQGQGGTLLISGEAGLGKSRLAREAASLAAERGIAVLRGACFDRDKTIPYAPFLDLLREAATTSPDGISAHVAALAPGLRSFLPELATGPSTPLSPLQPGQYPHQLPQEIAALLSAMAHERPSLLVIEDIHWSDEASFDVLWRLVRAAASSPLWLLVTYRADVRGAALGQFLAEVDRSRLAAEIALAPLTSAEVAQQVRAILELSRPPGAVFVRSLHGLTGGNPFFVEEVLRSLIAAGDVFPTAEGWQRKPLEHLRVPRSVEEAVRRGGQQLSDTAREILTLAAVIGRRADFALLQEVSGLSDPEMISALKELIAASLLVEESTDVFAFRHALIRQAIYTDLLGRERQLLHARVAAVLDHRASNFADPGEIAYHVFEAADWPLAYQLNRAAGDRAVALYAPHAAAEQYSRAITAAGNASIPPDAELFLARGRAFDAIGDFEAARLDFEAGLAAAESTANDALALDALLALGLLWSGRNYDRAHEWLLRAIDVARAMPDTAALGHALNRLGNWHANNEEIDPALRCHDEALAIFEALRDRAGCAETLDLLAMTQCLGGDLETAQQAAHRAVAIFAELGDRRGLASTLYLTTIPAPVFDVETFAGGSTVAAGIVSSERALAIAREIEWRSGESFFLALLGEVRAAGGEFGLALSLLEESIHIAEAIDHRQWITQARWGLANLHRLMLDPACGLAEMERTLLLAREINSMNWINATIAGLASCQIALGNTDTAATLLRERLNDATPLRTQSQRRLWAASVELALATNRPADALSVLDRLFATARNLTHEGEIPWLAQLKAAALAALGNVELAETLLTAAQTTARDQGALPRLRLLCQARAAVLRQQDRENEARTQEREAREITAWLAATIPDEKRRNEFLLAAGLAPPAAPSARPDPPTGGLTPREIEVAAQVAAGRSNREIASALFVSERTIEAHVANILRKLGARSRAGIAAWFERHEVVPPAT